MYICTYAILGKEFWRRNQIFRYVWVDKIANNFYQNFFVISLKKDGRSFLGWCVEGRRYGVLFCYYNNCYCLRRNNARRSCHGHIFSVQFLYVLSIITYPPIFMLMRRKGIAIRHAGTIFWKSKCIFVPCQFFFWARNWKSLCVSACFWEGIKNICRTLCGICIWIDGSATRKKVG